MNLKKYIGDRAFYRSLLAVAVPIIIQNSITNFISLLDNVMVGQIGTEQMSGVSIVNQLLFVFNLCIFGALSGAGLFGAQFYGNKEFENLKHTFRYKVIISLIICTGAIGLFLVAGEPLISLYLHEGGETGDLALTLHYAKKYLAISLFGLFPFTVTQIYASSLREVKHTVPPMTAGIIGVCVNMMLNYTLIFGKFGAPALGVEGAALATVISRFVECICVIVWTHLHTKDCPFIVGVYRSFRIPKELLRSITVTGTPLLLNETLWAAGQAMLLQCYSLRGIATVSAMNISGITFNTFSVLYFSMGTTIAILIGHRLGEGNLEAAASDAKKMIAFSTLLGVFSGILIASCSLFFPNLYNTTEEVRALASSFIITVAVSAPIQAILNASYFTLRSGGKTLLTFLFDSGYVWCFTIPLSYCMIRFTTLPVEWVYFMCYNSDIIRCIIGIILVKRGIWLNDLTKKH